MGCGASAQQNTVIDVSLRDATKPLPGIKTVPLDTTKAEVFSKAHVVKSAIGLPFKPVSMTDKKGIPGLRPHHVTIVGCGFLSTNTAFRLVRNGVAGRVTLTDLTSKRVKVTGEVLDLEDIGGMVDHAPLSLASQADIIVFTGGRQPRKGQVGMDVLTENKEYMQKVMTEMKPIRPETLMLVADEPNDVLTYFAQEWSGLPRAHVFGIGTTLEACRAQVGVSQTLGVHHRSVSCHLLGATGKHSFIPWSLAQICGIPLACFPGIDALNFDTFLQGAKCKCSEITERKGHHAYGTATVLTDIIECVLNDYKKVMSVSVRVPAIDSCVALPAVVGAEGISMVLNIWPNLNKEEQTKLSQGVQFIADAIANSK